MKLCRFRVDDAKVRVGLLTSAGNEVVDLTAGGLDRLDELLEARDVKQVVTRCTRTRLPRHRLEAVVLLAPVDEQEVWAAGVTYLRSKSARVDESDFSATAYERVYAAARPEIFFKALPQKVVGPEEAVGIRRDARWNVPEPELVLVFNSRGNLAGYTVGNDMSSRDIEGENLLYLPQAKIYDRSCALGPWIVVGASERSARTWTIDLAIRRAGREVFAGTTRVARIQRRFDGLRDYLFQSQRFPSGAALFTGTGIVPPDHFTLRAKDIITIGISGIGTLRNPVVVV